MKLATLRTSGGRTTAALATGDGTYVALPATDVGAFLRQDNWRAVAEAADGGVISNPDFAPLLPSAGKVICCGLNYGDHIQEMGRDLPEYPTLFAKYADTLVGANDPVEVHGSGRVDWEAELAVVVGSELYQADENQAREAIAGYTVANDVSMRDWQNRTLQWFQGKAWDRTTPVGPVLVTADEAGEHFQVKGYVNGELVQNGNTRTLVFGPAQLLSYISQFTILRPGDLVLTGTPGGVGMGMTPPRFLRDGDTLVTEIEGIGRLENRFAIHAPVHA
ncbi:fumarylacetoacetate hydrolase family protein [Paenarthrobacter sp. NPDC057981]|uniref:fumarylacetoacetate hydrolase family protein n=1 Tax=Paenarthrobacter sp. NPDC057981 TaxID=3346297 RepID=UPI0036D97202